jgi:hypothetical protein
MLAGCMQPVLPHKKDSFIDYIYHSTDGTGTLSLDSSFFGCATDLITSGDWTVPREGSLGLCSFEQ